MSDFLDGLEITEESVNGPYFGILYGPVKVGKTWLCKHAEKPIFLAVEKGVEKVKGVGKFTRKNENGDVEIIMPHSEDEFFAMLQHIAKQSHIYKTVVVDSGMFVDKLFCASVIAKNPKEKKGKDTYIDVTSIGDYNFGTGYEKVLSIWETRFFTALKFLHKKGMNVILIAHAREKNVSSEGDDYKKWGIDMLEFGRISVPNLLAAKADWILFMKSEAKTKKKLGGFDGKKVITYADNDAMPEVIVYTRETSSFHAGVRTEKIENVQDQYLIDFGNDATSKKLFEDLIK